MDGIQPKSETFRFNVKGTKTRRFHHVESSGGICFLRFMMVWRRSEDNRSVQKTLTANLRIFRRETCRSALFDFNGVGGDNSLFVAGYGYDFSYGYCSGGVYSGGASAAWLLFRTPGISCYLILNSGSFPKP
ncbi:hypothetical protein LWI28_008117 [Acer negundo]|uniref:Uncharacterized protein n=1 Tax=Acer negundo TaxID=4023 RepID=A0AAD5P128_ACENE|nr:hypothetical protein LWI28_008117 [Acer negundo]